MSKKKRSVVGDMCEETCDEEEGDPAAFCAAGI